MINYTTCPLAQRGVLPLGDQRSHSHPEKLLHTIDSIGRARLVLDDTFPALKKQAAVSGTADKKRRGRTSKVLGQVMWVVWVGKIVFFETVGSTCRQDGKRLGVGTLVFVPSRVLHLPPLSSYRGLSP